MGEDLDPSVSFSDTIKALEIDVDQKWCQLFLNSINFKPKMKKNMSVVGTKSKFYCNTFLDSSGKFFLISSNSILRLQKCDFWALMTTSWVSCFSQQSSSLENLRKSWATFGFDDIESKRKGKILRNNKISGIK